MKPLSVFASAFSLSLLVGPAFADETKPSGNTEQEKEKSGYDYTTRGTLLHESASGFLAKILIDQSNLGSDEVEIAELTFPVGYEGRSHLHDALEIFYVLSGRFGHSVNGEDAILEPGELGVVKPGDTVTHSVHGDAPAVVLTIWVPGGSAAPDFSNIPSRPIDKKKKR